MTNDSLSAGSGNVLLSTEWNQYGSISGSSIQYNEDCPTDPVTSDRCMTGCTNTAAAQILYYWLENSDFILQLQLSQEDDYVSEAANRSITIDATEATAQKNGYLSFAQVNQELSDFTIGNAADIAALCFACGVVQQAGYTSEGTSTSWEKELFARSGMAGCTVLSSYSHPYFYESAGSTAISDAVFDILINELLAGRPVGASIPGHALVIDGYDEAADKFHANYGWGGYKNGWYTRQEMCDEGFNAFYTDIMPDYDGSDILVTNSAVYGVGTFLRGMERLDGLFEADTLTVQTACNDLELTSPWFFEKDITINNLNVNIDSSSGIISSSGELTLNGVSGQISAGNVTAFYCSGRISITDFSGSVTSSSTAFYSSEALAITDFSGSVKASDTPLFSSGSISVTNSTGRIAGKSSFSVYGSSVSMQNFSGVCVAAGKGASYAVYATSGTVSVSANGGKIFAGTYKADLDALVNDLSVYGAAGIAKAISYNAKTAQSKAVSGNDSDDSVLLKNYSAVQGQIHLGDGSDTLSVLGGSYVYAHAISGVETLNIDSTSRISGVFYGSGADSTTINVTVTAETPSQEMIHIQDSFYNFYYYLKDKTLNIDLRAAADGEYVLVNAIGLQYTEYYLSRISAKINTGSKTITLKCGETSDHISLKYEEEKLILVLDGYSASQAEALLFDGENLLSVNTSFSDQTISAEGTDSLRLTNGGTAGRITVNAGGDLSVSNQGKAADTVVNACGFLAVNANGIAVNTTVNAKGILSVSSGGTISGSLQLQQGAVISVYEGAIIDFTVAEQTAPETALINDWSLIDGGANATYTLTVKTNQAAGIYMLADEAAGFNNTVTVRTTAGAELGTISVGETKTFANGDYTLSKDNGSLQLTIAAVVCPPQNLQGTSAGISWDGAADGFVAQYSTDSYVHSLSVGTATTAVDTYAMPEV